MSVLGSVIRASLLLELHARLIYRNVQLRFLCWIAHRRFHEVNVLFEFTGLVFKRITPQFSRARLATLNNMGYDSDPSGQRITPICWNAPITITIFIDDQPYLGLGVEIRGKALCIRQMQGVKGAEPMPELHGWPELLVRICMAYAEERGFREVRIYKANQEIGFEYPQVEPRKGQTYEEATREHQARMRRRYDRTAQKLKFKKKKRYYVWRVPPPALVV